MNGDIKGAFLSDTDDTDLVGSGELVTNGTFDTDVSGWTAVGVDGGTDTTVVSWTASGYMDVTRGLAILVGHEFVSVFPDGCWENLYNIC